MAILQPLLNALNPANDEAGSGIAAENANIASATNQRNMEYQYLMNKENKEEAQRVDALNRAERAPWLQAGTNALSELQTTPQFTGITEEQLLSDPSYKFRLNEGLNAITSQGLATGQAGSGNLANALMTRGQGMASQEYGNAYEREYRNYTTQINKLLSEAGLGGQFSPTVLSQQTTPITSNTSGVTNWLAQTGSTGQNNALSQVVGGIDKAGESLLQGYFSSKRQNELLDRIYGNNYDQYSGEVGYEDMGGTTDLGLLDY